MTTLLEIQHPTGSVNWLVAAARALEERLAALETNLVPKAKTEPKAAETPK